MLDLLHNRQQWPTTTAEHNTMNYMKSLQTVAFISETPNSKNCLNFENKDMKTEIVFVLLPWKMLLDNHLIVFWSA